MSQVFFRKDHEDAETVRYSFGQDYANFTRTLTVTKSDRLFRPEDGQIDRDFQKASWGISAGLRRKGVWPDRGQHVSG